MGRSVGGVELLVGGVVVVVGVVVAAMVSDLSW